MEFEKAPLIERRWCLGEVAKTRSRKKEKPA